MKLKLTFGNPDIGDDVRDSIRNSLPKNLSTEEKQELFDNLTDVAFTKLVKWLTWAS